MKSMLDSSMGSLLQNPLQFCLEALRRFQVTAFSTFPYLHPKKQTKEHLWAKHMTIYFPAVNNSNDGPAGVAYSVSPEIIGRSKCCCLCILQSMWTAIVSHLLDILLMTTASVTSVHSSNAAECALPLHLPMTSTVGPPEPSASAASTRQLGSTLPGSSKS